MMKKYLITALLIFSALSGCQKKKPDAKADATAVTGITLSRTEAGLVVGELLTITAAIEPENAANKNAAWVSSNTAVVELEEMGKIRAVGEGTANITVTTEDGGKTAVCKITVKNPIPVSGVKLNKTELTLETGGLETLVAKVMPANAENRNISWSSSAQGVATVDENGRVTAIAEGTATVTVTTEDGGKTASCKVTVPRDDIAVINGIKWALGNVTFDPSSCTNGVCTKLTIASDPYDRGLYFQWYGGTGGGQLIGYAGSGPWNVAPTDDKSTWRYVQPGATFPGSWPDHTQTGTVYHGVGTYKGEWTGNNPCTVVGGGWRLPTRAEMKASHPTNEEGKRVFTDWEYNPANGGYFRHIATGFVFPLAGNRHYSHGTLNTQNEYGYYWSSTEGDHNSSNIIFLYSGDGISAGEAYAKSHGFSVRCVRD